MQLDPSLPWETLFLRCMQSWRDGAPRRSTWTWIPSVCERCESDPLIAIAGGISWPHWMRHSFGDLTIELRIAVEESFLATKLDGTTLNRHIYGAGQIPKARLAPVQRQALELVDDYVQCVDLWLRDRVSRLGRWPERVVSASEDRM